MALIGNGLGLGRVWKRAVRHGYHGRSFPVARETPGVVHSHGPNAVYGHGVVSFPEMPK
jgi:hypothetical protein